MARLMEGKYGRLYTEQDVRFIVEATLALDEREPTRIHDRALADVTREAVELADKPGVLTFPADEPLFLLRGQDACAPDAIASGYPVLEETGRSSRDYVQTCLNAHAPREHVEAIWKAASAMRDWQREHPERVKVPE